MDSAQEKWTLKITETNRPGTMVAVLGYAYNGGTQSLLVLAIDEILNRLRVGFVNLHREKQRRWNET